MMPKPFGRNYGKCIHRYVRPVFDVAKSKTIAICDNCGSDVTTTCKAKFEIVRYDSVVIPSPDLSFNSNM